MEHGRGRVEDLPDAVTGELPHDRVSLRLDERLDRVTDVADATPGLDRPNPESELSYQNHFHIFDREGTEDLVVEASKQPPIAPRPIPSPPLPTPPETMDYTQRVLHCAFHPERPLVAVAALRHLFLYEARKVSA